MPESVPRSMIFCIFGQFLAQMVIFHFLKINSKDFCQLYILNLQFDFFSKYDVYINEISQILYPIPKLCTI